MVPAPPAFGTIMQFMGVPVPLQRRLWQAVSSSRWSRVCEWRQVLGLFAHTRLLTSRHLLCDICRPAEMVMLIEELYKEKRLDRRSASQIQEHVFYHTTRHGEWYDGPKTREGHAHETSDHT
jgi:hypothetical protein